ncbi:hypothetical protein OPV22_027976 [Ensete ventricosum]|uniref:BHLH domain-containing protein n=1 Tax=Ensete ventricosum TaxID=4639 RepID=A0AAV8Q252_ENSVE|nr:hypothetical protein OPV22_027976 [Ensete ventricosum]
MLISVLRRYKKKETDYIHVRARRGQATDSHSLAERVRRERISERMMKSLQRQVEFLSMRLAAADPRMHLSGSNFFDGEEVSSLSNHYAAARVSFLQQLNASCNSSSVPVMGVSPDQLNLSGLLLPSLQQDALCSSYVLQTHTCSSSATSFVPGIAAAKVSNPTLIAVGNQAETAAFAPWEVSYPTI